MESNRVVSRARAQQFATEVGGILCETSAKENWGVNELFTKVRVAPQSRYKRPSLCTKHAHKQLPFSVKFVAARECHGVVYMVYYTGIFLHQRGCTFLVLQ